MQNRNFFPSASPKKCPRGWTFSRFFALAFRKKNNISRKKLKFFNEGWIKYEFLTHLKFKTRKHQPKIWILSCFYADTSIKIRTEDLQIFVVFRLILNFFDFFTETSKIAIFFQLRIRKSYIEVEFFYYFLHTYLEHKKNISRKYIEIEFWIGFFAGSSKKKYIEGL